MKHLNMNGKSLIYKLFVYGSLKAGNYNHKYLERSNFLGEYYIDKGYGLFKNGLPYLIEHKDGPGCYGELYEVDNFTLSDIDILEGHPNWYKRILTTVFNVETKQPEKAYVYIYQGEKNGDFIRRF